MKLISIPQNKYHEYKLDEMFLGYKWDPQWIDNNTISRHALVLDESEAAHLEALTEKLTAETIAAEMALKDRLDLCKPLALGRQIFRALKAVKSYNPKEHIRLMRFDFHPVVGGGFALSEVNSDVPGGFAECSVMPLNAAKFLEGDLFLYRNFGDILADAIASKARGGRVALIHCTSYSDDRQHMQFLGDRLRARGLSVVYCAADHIAFDKDKKALCLLDGYEGKIDCLFRFTPLEWLKGLPRAWKGFFDTVTPSCNHPVVMFAQTKRIALLWQSLEDLGVDLTEWKRLLPETLDPRKVVEKEGFIYKPACGRVGEGITIKGTMPEQEYQKILRDVRRHPRRYIAQKKFESKPLLSPEGKPFHICLGVYSVEGKAAGFYARASGMARIDSGACDIPVLVERGTK